MVIREQPERSRGLVARSRGLTERSWGLAVRAAAEAFVLQNALDLPSVRIRRQTTDDRGRKEKRLRCDVPTGGERQLGRQRPNLNTSIHATHSEPTSERAVFYMSGVTVCQQCFLFGGGLVAAPLLWPQVSRLVTAKQTFGNPDGGVRRLSPNGRRRTEGGRGSYRSWSWTWRMAAATASI